MACTSIFLSSHLLSSARIHKSRNTRKLSPINPKPSPAINSAGGEATSYTRLPPKDDFQLDPSTPFYNIIKLREVIVPPVDSMLKSSSKPTIFSEEISEESEGEEEEEFLRFDSDDVKEKGVPAVMRCFDRAKIYVKAGDGGNGVVAFRREKFVPYGGPSGGDGGKGGDVYVEVDGSMNSLLSFRKNVHFRAGRGGHGLGRKQAGGKGEDLVVMVAPGTVVRESRKGLVEGVLLLELLKVGQRALLVPGGRGGRGNASFKSGIRKAPKIAENGEAGAEM